MDAEQFDRLARSLSTIGSRRHALTIAASGAVVVLGLTGPDDLEAKKKKPCPPCKRRKKGNCKGTLPDGTGCSGGTCQSGRCIAASCVPNCAGKTCGSDGCTGTCGPCTGGTCTAGSCVCLGGTEPCQGGCVPTCVGSQVLNPGTCGCCRITFERCGVDGDCCSGQCSPGGNPICEGRTRGQACEFNAQCDSEVCTNGSCACRLGQIPCADASNCALPCPGGRFFYPGSCGCCRTNGESCAAGWERTCCAGTDQCINNVCQGRPDGAACTSALQCASGKCPSFTNRCGEPPIGP